MEERDAGPGVLCNPSGKFYGLVEALLIAAADQSPLEIFALAQYHQHRRLDFLDDLVGLCRHQKGPACAFTRGADYYQIVIRVRSAFDDLLDGLADFAGRLGL